MKRFMVGVAAVIVLASFFIFMVMAADLPSLNDGSDHGDPPYLTESGWKPLLNGKDLSGWELADPNKKGKWLATSAVIRFSLGRDSSIKKKKAAANAGADYRASREDETPTGYLEEQAADYGCYRRHERHRRVYIGVPDIRGRSGKQISNN